MHCYLRCKKQQYPRELPTASVIIIFRNELLRVVLRTVHSVVNRTPPRYLKEVILVDDASERGMEVEGKVCLHAIGVSP